MGTSGLAKQTIPLQLDKIRNLRFSLKALSDVEEMLGKSLSEINLTKMTIKQLFTFVWAGLYHEDHELTVERIFELVDEFSSVNDVSVAFTKAIQESFPKKA